MYYLLDADKFVLEMSGNNTEGQTLSENQAFAKFYANNLLLYDSLKSKVCFRHCLTKAPVCE